MGDTRILSLMNFREVPLYYFILTLKRRCQMERFQDRGWS